MAISATFTADFSKFNKSLADAKDSLKTFEVTGKGVQQSLERMAKSFSGVELKKQAEVAAAAVEKIGGAAKLTASEQKKLTSTVDEALAKYKALGETAPTSLIKLRGELTKIADEEKRIKDGADHLKKLAGDTAGIAAPAEAGALSFGKLASSVFTAQAAYDAIRTTGRLVLQFLGDSIQSYAAAEAAQRKLTTALQAQGNATPEVIGQFNDLASTFQNTTVYSDDLINEMEALLVQIGDVMPQDMSKALTASTDLASGLGIDLRTATLLVGKAMAGETGTLSRYGIVLDQARVKAEGADYVLGELEKRFGGQAQAQLNTYAGRVQAIANAWDNVKESVGKVIVTNPIVEAGLRGVQSGLSSAGDEAGKSNIPLSEVLLRFQGFIDKGPLAGGAIAQFAGQTGAGIGLLEQFAQAANDTYNILAKLEANAPKLQINPGFNFKPVTDGLTMFWEEQDKAKKAADAHAESIRKLREQMSGAALLKDLKDNIAAFQGLPKPIQDSKIAEDALVDAYIRALPALENASAAMLKQTSYAAGLAVSLGKLEPPIENTATVLKGLGQTLSVDTFFGGLDSVGFEAALVRPFVSLKTEAGSIPTSTLFPIQQKMSDLAKMAIDDFGRMNTAIQGAFAQMLIGAKGFKDGFLDIWNSIKSSIARILTDILSDFTNRFISGLISAMRGGSFQSAFSGMFSGFGGLFGGGGGGAGFGGIGSNIAPGSMFTGMPGGAASVPWWQTGLGGGLIGAGAGAAVGGYVGGRTGNMGAGIASGAGTGFATGFMFGGPIGGLIGLGVGGLVGGYRARQANKKANDNRDTFLSQFGGQGTGEGSGFLTLAQTLTKAGAGAGGGDLFKNLIKANDPQELAEAIAKVNEKLAEYEAKTKAAGAAEADQAAKIDATKAALEEKTKAIHDQMQGLDDELKRLDASEAPEAHMGTVEKRARERIAKEKADLQRQLDAAQEAAAKAIEVIKAAGTASSDELKTQGGGVITDLQDGFVKLGDLGVEQIDRVRQLLEEMQRKGYHIPVSYDTPPGTGSGGGGTGPGPSTDTTPGYASGTPNLGFVNFGRESLVRLHGEEAVIPKAKAAQMARQWGVSGGSASGPTTVVLHVDGREFARAVVPTVPSEARRLGVRVRT